jgi:hypothetical protein
MKTDHRITLFKWHSKDEIIEVDWPKVHREVGSDQINWLLRQPSDQCQVVVDKFNENFTLVAEFYNKQILVDYYLRWAK